MIKVSSLKCDKAWAFDKIGRSATLYATHGYHRYPAKFIPQIVQKIINRYSEEKDVVLDPFGGCGTTLVEARLQKRNSIGVDVNDVAVIISKAKTKEIIASKIYNDFLYTISFSQKLSKTNTPTKTIIKKVMK